MTNLTSPGPDPAPEDDRVWWEITVRGGPASLDLSGEALRDIVPAGFIETADGITAYLPDRETAEKAAAAVTAAGAVSAQLRPVAEAEWGVWRRAFRPVAVGERLRIVPVWDAAVPAVSAGLVAHDAPGDVTVVIEPGLAFGTGDHPTTAACLQLLERLVREGAEVLDAGTGSGILAIAAALLGAGRVVAVDIDPVACRSATANIALNPGAREKVSVCCRDIAELAEAEGGPVFDIIVANLTSDVVIALLPTLLQSLVAGGRMVLSGISVEREGDVMLALDAAGLAPVDLARERGWLTVCCERGGGL